MATKSYSMIKVYIRLKFVMIFHIFVRLIPVAGCGESSRVSDASTEAPWLLTIDYYHLEELPAIIQHYQLQEYYVYGSSWGTCIAQEHAVLRPPGLCGIILDGALSDPHLYIETQWRDRISTLPTFTQNLLRKIVAEKDFTHPAYQQINETLTKHFTLRTIPYPDVWQKCIDGTDSKIYVAMQGKCEFCIGGVLDTWHITDRLPNINVPALVLAGQYDTMTEECSNAIVIAIPGAWPLVVIPRASHCKLLEEPQLCIEAMIKYMDDTEVARSKK